MVVLRTSFITAIKPLTLCRPDKRISYKRIRLDSVNGPAVTHVCHVSSWNIRRVPNDRKEDVDTCGHFHRIPLLSIDMLQVEMGHLYLNWPFWPLQIAHARGQTTKAHVLPCDWAWAAHGQPIKKKKKFEYLKQQPACVRSSVDVISRVTIKRWPIQRMTSTCHGWYRNMSVQQELQCLMHRNGPMSKKPLLNRMIAVIRLFFTNFQG